jgi:hypothetical protein
MAWDMPSHNNNSKETAAGVAAEGVLLALHKGIGCLYNNNNQQHQFSNGENRGSGGGAVWGWGGQITVWQAAAAR